MHTVCLIGAGNIAPVHLQALQELGGASVVAVCDTNLLNATSFTQRHGIGQVFQSVGEALASGTFDCAHLLIPPPAHEAVALQLLDAGVHVFVEKPLALHAAGAQRLRDAAEARQLKLGVNHNQLFHPAYVRLRRIVRSGQLGPVRHVAAQFNLPSPFGDNGKPWLFDRPANLVYESGPHPFSLIYDLAGRANTVRVAPAARHELGGGRYSYAIWQIALECERAAASLLLEFGGTFPSMAITVTCEDGIAHADLVNNRVLSSRRSRWPDFYASFLDGARTVAALGEQSVSNLRNDVAGILRPGTRTDPYYVSMKRSIAAFHAPNSRVFERLIGSESGVEVVRMCDLVADALPTAGRADVRVAERRRECGRKTRCDVAVIGGSGFIGRHVVRRLVEDGRSVRIFGRSAPPGTPPFDHPLVDVFRGDIADRESVFEGLRGAERVVHLAHGGRMDFEGVESSMVAGTGYVGEACLASGARRLVYAGSIASLYLGDAGEVITAATPNDARAAERGAYPLGKVRSEEILQRLHRQDGLPVSIVRPGIVLGEGGTPFHFGFGRFRNEIHCLGWSAGINPLPLVLVEEVADAIILALDAPAVIGRTYNLVGDVRLSARECVAQLARVLAPRPIQFHPRRPAQIQALRLSRWAVEAALSPVRSPMPSYREVLSNACFATFDTTAERAELGWQPVHDRDYFVHRAFDVHRPPRPGVPCE